MEGAACRLVARRENRVFRVDHGGASYALRLHRPGYRAPGELRSELGWVAEIARRGLRVPRPVPTLAGPLLAEAGGAPASLLTWLDGGILDPPELGAGHMHALGAALARLHAASDDWRPPDGFSRPAWDREGLVGEAPLWGRFWESPALGAEDRRLLERLREVAWEELARLEADYGLIHADALRENVLWEGRDPALIDFDDGGWGHRQFELATSLGRLAGLPAYAELKRALLGGYRSVRALDAGASSDEGAPSGGRSGMARSLRPRGRVRSRRARGIVWAPSWRCACQVPPRSCFPSQTGGVPRRVGAGRVTGVGTRGQADSPRLDEASSLGTTPSLRITPSSRPISPLPASPDPRRRVCYCLRAPS